MLLGYVIMCLIFGTTFVAIKVGLVGGFSPLLFAGLRFASAGLITLALVRFQRLPMPKGWRQYGAIASVGMASTTITFGSLFWAQQYIPSGLASVVTASLPLLTLLISRRQERGGLSQALGVATGLAGVGMVMSPSLQVGDRFMTLLAVAVLIVCEFANAWGGMQAQRVMKTGIPPLTFNALQMLIGGVGLLLGAALFEGGRPLPTSLTAWGALIHLSIIGSVVARGLYYWLIARTGPLFPSTWTYVSPALTTMLGGWLLSEPVSPLSIAGVVLVIGGVGLTNLHTFKEIKQAWGRPRTAA